MLLSKLLYCPSVTIFGACLWKLLYRQGFLPSLSSAGQDIFLRTQVSLLIDKSHFLENFCRDEAEEGLLCFRCCFFLISFFPCVLIVCLVDSPTWCNLTALQNEFQFLSSNAKTLANNNNLCLLIACCVPAIALSAFLVLFCLIKITV